MENIVFGLKNLNFHQSFPENRVFRENCAPNFATNKLSLCTSMDLLDSTGMALSASSSLPVKERDNERRMQDIVTATEGESSNSSEDGEATRSNRSSRGGVCVRRLPARASKDSALTTVRQSITKPKKRISREFKVCTNISDIKRVYLNKKLPKLNTSNLETIFEEEGDEIDGLESEICTQVRVVKFGNRKLRRSISMSDGLNANKALIKKRRAKIKKNFGRKALALKKISMDEFHDRLNKSFD